MESKPEEIKQSPDELKAIKGMRELENKNIIQDLVSKNHTWQAFNVPQEIIDELEDMKMDKPSKI